MRLILIPSSNPPYVQITLHVRSLQGKPSTPRVAWIDAGSPKLIILVDHVQTLMKRALDAVWLVCLLCLNVRQDVIGAGRASSSALASGGEQATGRYIARPRLAFLTHYRLFHHNPINSLEHSSTLPLSTQLFTMARTKQVSSSLLYLCLFPSHLTPPLLPDRTKVHRW